MKVAENGSQHGWICFLRQVELHVHHRELAVDYSAGEESGSSEGELAVSLISEKDSILLTEREALLVLLLRNVLELLLKLYGRDLSSSVI